MSAVFCILSLAFCPLSHAGELHDAIVRAVVARMAVNGFGDIRADLKGYRRPAMIDHRIPDATGIKGGVLYIYEIETAHTLGSAHTAAQWRAFSGAGRFIVVVPEGMKKTALARAAEIWIAVFRIEETD